MRTYFTTISGYGFLGFFALITGYFFIGQNIVGSSANYNDTLTGSMIMFLILVPVLTMRLFAEEKQTGTWELLITKPISKLQIATGKYLAGWLLVIIALLPTLLYYFSVSYLAEPMGNVDSGAFWGSFIGLIFLSGVYVAIGLFASSLSNNQIVSFVVAVVLSFFFYYGFEALLGFFNSGSSIQTLENMGIHAHYKSMSRGVIDSRDVLYFVTLSAGFLGLTVWKIRK
jgi:ABC-2 type transport system permease protein